LFWVDHGAVPYLTSGLVLALIALGAQAEFYTMLRSAGLQPAVRLGLLAGAYYLATRLVPGVAWSFGAREGLPTPDQSFDAGAHLAGAVVFLLALGVLGRRPEGAPQRIGSTLIGLLVVPFLLGYVIEIRYLSDGWAWVIFLVAVTKTGDSAAFFVGRFLGRHKLIPAVSPNKTWEGAAASVVGSLLTGWLVAVTAFDQPPETWLWLVAGLVVNLGAQFGDLGESLLKRGCDVKDSARLLPVMGGLFDLVDSFLVAAPVLRLLLAFTAYA
ncbi:MAG TPA: phosphatidate cytidylyltransferase, partial [Planctomycetota bacterium]